ncbi:MAG: hypothetical protein IPM48_14935 [Saprospiraceae bacterium]|nr:hypothetical protein [Saprospiraceae bacterium]
MTYLEFQTKPKALTTKEDIGGGQIGLKSLDPPLFLELQFIKLHTHKGVDSRKLQAEATPEMVRAFRPLEREEHGVVTWSGSGTSGSVALTFSTPFTEVPDVFVTPQDGDVNIQAVTNTPTINGVTIYWKNDAGNTETSVNVAWLAKGR